MSEKCPGERVGCAHDRSWSNSAPISTNGATSASLSSLRAYRRCAVAGSANTFGALSVQADSVQADSSRGWQLYGIHFLGEEDGSVVRRVLWRELAQRWIKWSLLASVVIAACVLPARRAAAYTPESPEVVQMLDRALDFLENHALHNRLGGKSLIALALIKGGRSYEQPLVKEAVAACQDAVTTFEDQHPTGAIYDLAIAIIFLCELDPDQYRSEITALMELLLKWQKDFGAWGYLQGTHLATGDTSMTQYGVLASWTADRTGAFPVRPESAAAVCNWLIRTQSINGGWAYQGQDPGTYQRLEQIGVQHSLSAAGAGSIYCLADLLRLTKGMGGGRNDNDGLPPALRIVRKPDEKPSRGPMTDAVDRDRLRIAMRDGDGWFERNFQIEANDWLYYYLYALERYKSFRELVTGQSKKEPDWYNKGVEFLQREQNDAGAWDADNGPSVDTSFGILFLVRGTQKSIQKAAAFGGRLRGGRGLPTNTAEVVIGEDGQIVKTPFQGKAESLLSLLEAVGQQDADALNRDFEIQLSDDPQQRRRELERLRRLMSADEFAVRMTVIKALYNVRSLDEVPTFICALGDPDPRIVQKARDALRLLSRRIDGMGLPDNPTQAEKIDAIDRWKKWYLSIRPDAQFRN